VAIRVPGLVLAAPRDEVTLREEFREAVDHSEGRQWCDSHPGVRVQAGPTGAEPSLAMRRSSGVTTDLAVTQWAASGDSEEMSRTEGRL
jgi:hypothetical protein